MINLLKVRLNDRNIRCRDKYINAQMKNTIDQKKEHQISRLVDEKIDLQICWETAENLDQ